MGLCVAEGAGSWAVSSGVGRELEAAGITDVATAAAGTHAVRGSAVGLLATCGPRGVGEGRWGEGGAWSSAEGCCTAGALEGAVSISAGEIRAGHCSHKLDKVL